ncbi:hypothetical protein TrVE_jg14001 [Triparma verrucosa]|uniref:Uncharacterized protein n=1 Tax=Triparma verrucosa TaxID=1606542 RepID=A0A9W7KUR8_9STRA|nr:hypothetical protein TrVE_jg14001 [Triparma verrucosa]
MKNGSHDPPQTPCPHEMLTVEGANDEHTQSGANETVAATYYSDWSVYAQTVAPKKTGFTKMTNTWTVPSIPENHGPASQSSVYLFNGLEDGGGVHGAASVILQPVLQYGKSGCLLNPTKRNSWYFSSYVVDGNGRAHCADLIPVDVGEEITGIMTKADDGSNEWTVESIAAAGTSVNTVDMGDVILDSAYLTLEGMVVYTCDTYPGEGEVEFTENGLQDEGGEVKTNWVEEVRHDECNQGVEVDGSGEKVRLTWDPSL